MDCYTTALRILSYRFNSAAELRRKLAAKKFDDDVINATLERLRNEKWLDDDRFAAAYVRTRVQKKIGRLRIRRELIAAGVDDDSIDRAIAENNDTDRERDNLAAACEKRRRALDLRHGEGYAASTEGRAKLAAQLVRQGFDFDAVKIAVGELGRKNREFRK